MTIRGLPSARAIWWAQRAASRTKADLAASTLDELVVLQPPALPTGCRRWVATTLRVRRDSCLVRSAVLQTWDASHGRPRDLVIGVTAPAAGFKAHAWLDGEPASVSAGYVELTRRPPPTTAGRPTAAPARSGGQDGQQAVDETRKIGPHP